MHAHPEEEERQREQLCHLSLQRGLSGETCGGPQHEQKDIGVQEQGPYTNRSIPSGLAFITYQALATHSLGIIA